MPLNNGNAGEAAKLPKCEPASMIQPFDHRRRAGDDAQRGRHSRTADDLSGASLHHPRNQGRQRAGRTVVRFPGARRGTRGASAVRSGHVFGIEFADAAGATIHRLTATNASNLEIFLGWVRLHQGCSGRGSAARERGRRLDGPTNGGAALVPLFA
jgi:hypothetical protein